MDSGGKIFRKRFEKLQAAVIKYCGKYFEKRFEIERSRLGGGCGDSGDSFKDC